ncbi:MAG: hypothetical protein QXY49_03610 [Thermofilaceae archaeon]
MKAVKAYSPAGLSGIFSAYTDPLDPYCKGARGAGIVLTKGVEVIVEIEEGKKWSLDTYLNGSKVELGLAKRILQRVLEKGKVEGNYRVTVKQYVKVPIGGGLGTSGACALAMAIALGKALNVKMSYYELAREAHVAEIEEGTGLGTISGLVVGGVVVVREPGAPGFDKVDRILVDPGLKVVIGFFSSIDKRVALSKTNINKVNELGQKLVSKLVDNPTLENFINCCRIFTEQAGFVTERVRDAIIKAERTGAIGASQAMIGETVFALAYRDCAEQVAECLRKLKAKVLVSNIEWGPARLIEF